MSNQNNTNAASSQANAANAASSKANAANKTSVKYFYSVNSKASNSSDRSKKSLPVWTILAFINFIFPPVGLVLTIIRCAMEKKLHVYDQDEILSPAIAVICVSLAEMALIGGISLKSNDGAAIIMGIYLLAVLGGIIMLVTRRRNIRMDEEVDMCWVLIQKGYLTDTEEMAKSMGISRDRVEDLIELMIPAGEKAPKSNAAGFAYPGMPTLAGFELIRDEHRVHATAPYKFFRNKCKNCGAETQLMKGRDLTCPYCGNPVEI
ncbi:MAG: hypothetical protein KBS83_08870 [Lachnospiraceae bacterium]|nr:hypothetical protein [Candidatus Equihabitans merdae]